MLVKPAKFLGYFLTISFISVIALTTPTYASSTSFTQWVDSCSDWDDWDKPGPAFRIFANSYYVGSCGISAILVTGDEGHILIDGGTEAGAKVIADNIVALGFSLADIKILLHSHEHFDHVAGLAELQKLTGAKLLASAKAAPVLASGLTSDEDPQAGMHNTFPAAQVNSIINEGDEVKLGQLILKPISTPGHSPGALSWQWQACEKDHCVNIVYADSLSPVSSKTYHFSDHPKYLEEYRTGLTKLANLDCDILIAPHPSASGMRDALTSEKGLFNPKACINYADNVSSRLDKRLSEEK